MMPIRGKRNPPWIFAENSNRKAGGVCGYEG